MPLVFPGHGNGGRPARARCGGKKKQSQECSTFIPPGAAGNPILPIRNFNPHLTPVTQVHHSCSVSSSDAPIRISTVVWCYGSLGLKLNRSTVILPDAVVSYLEVVVDGFGLKERTVMNDKKNLAIHNVIATLGDVDRLVRLVKPDTPVHKSLFSSTISIVTIDIIAPPSLLVSWSHSTCIKKNCTLCAVTSFESKMQ